MTNQEILDAAPEGATHVDGEGDYIDINGVYLEEHCYASDAYVEEGIRSLSDIRRIVELESQLEGASQCFDSLGPITASAESTQYGGSDIRMKNTPQWDEVASVVETIKATEQAEDL